MVQKSEALLPLRKSRIFRLQQEREAPSNHERPSGPLGRLRSHGPWDRRSHVVQKALHAFRHCGKSTISRLQQKRSAFLPHYETASPFRTTTRDSLCSSVRSRCSLTCGACVVGVLRRTRITCPSSSRSLVVRETRSVSRHHERREAPFERRCSLTRTPSGRPLSVPPGVAARRASYVSRHCPDAGSSIGPIIRNRAVETERRDNAQDF